VQPERAVLGAIADADDLERLLEAGGHPVDHVRDQRPRQPVQGAVLPLVGRALDADHAVLALDDHVPVQRALQLPAGTLHPDRAPLDRDVHALRDGDRLLSDT
jgi:hypothetical protein